MYLNKIILLGFLAFNINVTYSNNSLYETYKPLIMYLRTSDFLNEDLKDACKKNPEYFFQLAVQLPVLFDYVRQRPHASLAAESLDHLINRNLRGKDILIASNCIECYGEAALQNSEIHILPSEKTQRNYNYFDPFDISLLLYKHKEFKSSFLLITNLIQEIGETEKWSEDKVNTAIELFFQKCVEILQNPPDNCLILESSLFDKEVNKIYLLEDDYAKQQLIKKRLITKRNKLQTQLYLIKKKLQRVQ